MTAARTLLIIRLATPLAVIAIIATWAACAATAYAQRVDDSLPPLADLTIASEYNTARTALVRWDVTVKNNTVGAHPGVHVHLVKVEITLWDSVRSTSTQMWTIRNLPPGDSATRTFEAFLDYHAGSDLPVRTPQRFYAKIIESVPAESPRFGFNNATEHWAIVSFSSAPGLDGGSFFNNGDFGLDIPGISDPSPEPGGATTFTVAAYNDPSDEGAIPGVSRLASIDHSVHDLQVEISLSPGLSFAGTQPEPPSLLTSATTFDTNTGIWNVGTMPRQPRVSPALSLPVAVNLTAASLADLPLEERCLTAKVVRAVPWFANDPLKRVDDTDTACLGRPTVLSSGTMDLVDFYPCIGVTSTPCTSADTLELVVSVGDDKRIEWPDSFTVHVPDPGGRTTKSGSTIWSTVNLMDLRDSQTRLTSSWEIKESVKVTAPGGGNAPGRWLLTDLDDDPGSTFDLLDAMDSSTVTYEFFDLSEIGTDPTEYSLDVKVELWEMGTYEALYGISGRLSGTTYTDSGTYIFHVGPIADLEVRDAGVNLEVAAGQSAYTILAVNNGPDIAPAVQVTLTGVLEGAEAVPSQGSYAEGTCQSGLCEGVWTIGELSPGYHNRPSVYGKDGVTLALIAASGDPITAGIKNTQNYCVLIETADPDSDNDRECTGSAPSGYTKHSTAYYDHIEGNNTTTVALRAGTGERAGAPSTTVAIHGAELALLSWSPVKNLYGYPVTRYEIERSERGASLSWSEFEDADEMFHYAHSGGGGGNLAYRVRAVNEFGVPGPWSQVETEEQMVRGPSAPGGLMATVDGMSVTLSWNAPTDNRGSDLTAYRIDRQRDNRAARLLTSSHATTTRMYEDSGLLPGQRYCYRVAAVNANGEGEFSEWVCATTESVPGPPASLEAVAVGDDTVTLTWNAPAEDGGSAITGYRIDYTKDGGGQQTEVSDSATTTREYEHASLDAGTDYCYRVAAINDNGTGLFSGQACATTETVPGAPRSLRAAAKGENAVTLNWRAPSSDGGSAVTGYRIEHSTDDGDNWQTLRSVQAVTTDEHASLSAGSRHCYRVAAVNTHGEGPLSGQACATTDGAPAAPWNLRAEPASETSIRLEWNEPSDDGGSAITGYRVEYYDGAEWQMLADGLATTTYEHTERDAGTNYCYRVAAINSNGTGPYSGQACATTAGSPDAPENLRAEADGKTRITLTWDPPTDTGGATIIGYRIDYSTDGGGEWMALELDYERTLYGHSGLSPGGSYCYRVAAVHDNGTGPFSDQTDQTCATTEGAPTDLPGEPENLRLTQVGRDYVTLKWDPPSLGGEVEYYEYRYNQEDPVRVTAGRTEATVRGLFERFSYDFQVRAGNSLGAGEWAPSFDSLPVQATVGGLGIVTRSLELEFKKNAQGDYGSGSFNVKLNGSPKWPMSVGLIWDGDVCLTDDLAYQQFRILLPGDPSPSKEFWNDPYWAGVAASWRTGIDINVDASRCRGGETAVVHLDIVTISFETIAGVSLWDDEALNLDRAEWEQKWGIPDEYQSGPSVKLSAVE